MNESKFSDKFRAISFEVVNSKDENFYNTNMPILHWYKEFGMSFIYDYFYVPRKKIAKNWALALKELINDLKQQYLSIDTNEQTFNAVAYHAYYFLQVGKNVKCIDVFKKVLPDDLRENEKYNSYFYYFLSIGVELSELLPIWEKELFELETPKILNDIKPETQKLSWNGNKNQLYSVLRQLKEKELIGNTYDELVEFLHSNVSGFENDNKGTTARELKRDIQLPKSKRINLDTDMAD